MHMKIIIFLLSLVVVACSGKIRLDSVQTFEYKDATPGKPLVFPAGVDKPEQTRTYEIPSAAEHVTAANHDANDLVEPPRLVPIPSDDDDEDQDKAETK